MWYFHSSKIEFKDIRFILGGTEDLKHSEGFNPDNLKEDSRVHVFTHQNVVYSGQIQHLHITKEHYYILLFNAKYLSVFESLGLYIVSLFTKKIVRHKNTFSNTIKL